MKYLESMIVWTPNGESYAANPTRGKIAVVPWPDDARLSKAYRMSFGACFLELHKKPTSELAAVMLRDFHMAVVHGRIDPQAASDAFMQIDEFREIVAPDDND